VRRDRRGRRKDRERDGWERKRFFTDKMDLVRRVLKTLGNEKGCKRT